MRRALGTLKLYRCFSIDSLVVDQLVTNVRLGHLQGVSRALVDGCVVCTAISSPDLSLPDWMNAWKHLHDGYDEENAGSGSVESECKAGQGRQCGKYCCKEWVPAEILQ